MSTPAQTLWQSGFRPFFLGAAFYGAFSMVLWWLFYAGHQRFMLSPVAAMQWHAHEMIYGYAMAVVAGFLLTAARNWTGRETASGHPLNALFALWLLARLLPLGGDAALPWAAAADGLFNLGLWLAVARPIVQVRQWRQAGILAKLLLLAVGNGLYYAGALGWLSAAAVHWGLYGGFWLIIGLILTMSRRVVPFFIERGLGLENPLPNARWMDLTSLLALLGIFVEQTFFPTAGWLPWLALLAFAVLALRLKGWHHPAIWKNPMLWSLWLAQLWMILGLAVLAARLWLPVNIWTGMHFLAVGGIGLITLAMMSRVSLGHTGRAVNEPPAGIGRLFVWMSLATAFRTVPLLAGWGEPALWVQVSMALWVLATVEFLRIYRPILTAPRLDGRPG